MSSNSIINDVKQLETLLNEAWQLAGNISGNAESYADYYAYQPKNASTGPNSWGFGTWATSANTSAVVKAPETKATFAAIANAIQTQVTAVKQSTFYKIGQG